ncbi:DEAD/DEAH box helicase, partial [Treponema endosymbiont of Eucomonympha sp.]|uniref:DEAD/DEAH box helicase n=1 Tax=Treponema endosymbiont of Eucomonympha sp. TaxID=1580831 RepID=UPI0034D2ABBF
MEEYETGVPDPITQVAQRTFGVRYLFPWQRLVIANILDAVASVDAARAVPAGADSPECERSVWARQIVLLPTGAGKSLCFLVPAALLDRPTLAVYPLLALMSDQMRRVNASGLSAVAFRGGQSAEERAKTSGGSTRGQNSFWQTPKCSCLTLWSDGSPNTESCTPLST